MVKRIIVLLSAVALVVSTVSVVGAFLPGAVMEGDKIIIPCKVITKFEKKTGPGPFSALFMQGCQQYTNGPFPWGTWKGTNLTMKVEIKPPPCIAPAYFGPAQLGAPIPAIPGGKLVKAEESYGIQSPGCNPCVVDGLQYKIVKKQVVK